MKQPINLRIETEPYPHLRDNEGCVLANDYLHDDKLTYILHATKMLPDMLTELKRLYELHGYQATFNIIAKAEEK